MGLFGKRKPKPSETTYPGLRMKTGVDKAALPGLGQADRRPFPSESFKAALMLGDVDEGLSPEWSKMCAGPLRELNTDSRMTALAMYIIQHGPECWIM
jgi:hypothetical protein